MIKLISCHI